MLKLFIKCYTENYFNFRDRASRKEYISFFLFYGMICLIYEVLTLTFGFSLELEFLFFIIDLFLMLPFLNLNIRRLHDLGYSWFFQIILISVIIIAKYLKHSFFIITGLIFVLLLSFIKGTTNTNKYGEPPTY